MAYTNSNDIRIFPSSDRDIGVESQYGTNFITEYNLSSIVNKLICGGTSIGEGNANYEFPAESSNTTSNLHGFIISPPFNATSSIPASADSNIEFNLHGYFITTKISTVINSGKDNTSFASTSPGESTQNFVQFVQNGDYIYAVIACRDRGLPDISYAKLVGADGSSSTGTTYNSDTDSIYWLALLEGSGDSWEICKDSYIQLQNMSRIDDGEL